jgi:hypothetical protein
MAIPVEVLKGQRGMELGSCSPNACASCPWRSELHGTPHEKDFYTVENREAMWWAYPGMAHPKDMAGLSDGLRMACHATVVDKELHLREDAKPRYCAGGDAIQQRAFIRWCVSGNRWPFRGLMAGRAVLGWMLGMTPPEALDRIRLYGPWEVRGTPLTFAQVLEAAHPGVFDPGLVSELVPAPTDEEIALWRQAAADPDWNFPPGSPCGPMA